MSKARPLEKVTRAQWQRWRDLDKRRERGALRNEGELREFHDLMDKIRAVSAYWRQVR